MASETPRLDPREITSSQVPVFRLIAQVKSQPSENKLVLASPTEGGEMVTLADVRVSMSKNFEVGSWQELVCRSSDNGDVGFLVLDAVACPFKTGEDISVEGVVALQNLCKRFPEIY